MRLVSLTANKASFHAVNFNKTGLTLIVGQQKDASKKSTNKTYNGVGKSLLVALLHFCLGSNRNKEFESKIPDWTFILRVEHAGKEYRVSRSTSKQDVINVDGGEMGVKDFRETFEKLAFAITEPADGLTFRSLISYFMRPGMEGYISFDQTDGNSTPYDKLVRNAFLLGIDIGLIAKKQQLKLEKDHVREMKKSLSKDTVFKEYFTGNKNPDIELRDLEQKISGIKAALSEFKVADNYRDKQSEANATQRKVQSIRNQIVVLSNAIENIVASLQVKSDVAPEDVASIYQEAGAALPERVKRQLVEVADFHARILANRVSRLTAEKNKLEAERADLEVRLKDASQDLDELSKFLGEHGAFDEFVALNDQLAKVEAAAQKLRDYKGLLETYSNKTQEITAKQSEQTIHANRYLTENKELLDSNLDTFRSFSKEFYGKRPGGLTVKNNEGDNQTRFEIEAHIEDDASDGINEVKIFCYDMTLLSQRHNHSVEFIFHDSRLFSPVDKRQRAKALRIADKVCKKLNLQYIASLNEDMISSMKDEFTDAEYKQLIVDPTQLRLMDDKPASKLLGIEVDMQYDK